MTMRHRAVAALRENAVHENEIAEIAMDEAFRLHRELRPGLLETVYEVVLERRLEDQGL